MVLKYSVAESLIKYSYQERHRKVTGQAHKETIKSAKKIDENISILKTPLNKIKLKDLEKLHDKEMNLNLYNVLKERLEKFDDNPEKAFAEKIYMPLSPEKQKAGIKPHEIKSVKICLTQKSGLPVRNGVADNGDMVRIDIFSKTNNKGKNQYFAIPIYVSDLIKPNLPNKIVSGGKNGWIEINDDYNFQFSLFRNDLISINESGKEVKKGFLYYNSFDIDSSRIIVESIDRSHLADSNIKEKQYQKRYSILNLPKIKKYQVDILGNYSEVKRKKE
ncbi:MAG: hypothetical protein MZU84_03780 [Sphingobacterium sp.]|nr:hypothetical protein [Sphingobacterium sp.]